jgi:hypothetical protein
MTTDRDNKIWELRERIIHEANEQADFLLDAYDYEVLWRWAEEVIDHPSDMEQDPKVLSKMYLEIREREE